MNDNEALIYNSMLDTRDQYLLDSGFGEDMGSKTSLWWLWLLLLIVGIGLVIFLAVKIVLPIFFPQLAIGGAL